jgi:hypothetical protein
MLQDLCPHESTLEFQGRKRTYSFWRRWFTCAYLEFLQRHLCEAHGEILLLK